jgi:hypothetical protein
MEICGFGASFCFFMLVLFDTEKVMRAQTKKLFLNLVFIPLQVYFFSFYFQINISLKNIV